MPTTTKDIADRLGLSRPSVSKILNDAKGFQVSKETRRVLEAAKEMNYRPNAVARGLKNQRLNPLGVSFPQPDPT